MQCWRSQWLMLLWSWARPTDRISRQLTRRNSSASRTSRTLLSRLVKVTLLTMITFWWATITNCKTRKMIRDTSKFNLINVLSKPGTRKATWLKIKRHWVNAAQRSSPTTYYRIGKSSATKKTRVIFSRTSRRSGIRAIRRVPMRPASWT